MRDTALYAAAALWGFTEATLFFIVPDVLLTYLSVTRGPRPAAIASVIAALGAACGGALMYLWSQHEPEAAAAVAQVPAISSAMMCAHAAMGEHWFHATMIGPLTSTP